MCVNVYVSVNECECICMYCENVNYICECCENVCVNVLVSEHMCECVCE